MFFVAVVLPSAINEKVLVYKNMMLEKYECRVGLKSPAHITLIPPFWMEDDKKPALIEELEKLKGMQPFQLTTNNFSSFKPRTIFIAVHETEALHELKKATDMLFKDRPEFKIKIDERPFHPHITIATRDLHKKSFGEAWPWFEGKSFDETWIADGVSLLRHNTRTWEVIHTVPFQENEIS